MTLHSPLGLICCSIVRQPPFICKNIFCKTYDSVGLLFFTPLQALLLVERLCADWDRAAIKKPWNAREAINLHALCGAFLHHLDLLKAFLSGVDFQKEAKSLKDQFSMGFLDADLESALNTTVPPGSLTSLACMRPALRFKTCHVGCFSIARSGQIGF